MSKIGRKAIPLGDVQVNIKGQAIEYKGKNVSDVYVLPDMLKAVIDNGTLLIMLKPNLPASVLRDINRLWGMHRALLANAIQGASKEFVKELEIQGLGYKASLSGNKITFTLGFSHKKYFTLPEGVKLSINKSGQKLTFTSSDKELLGHVCSQIRSLKVPEPYKGTGIRDTKEVVRRKAGKTKAAV